MSLFLVYIFAQAISISAVVMAVMGSSETFFFFATMCLTYLAIMRWLVPETTGKTLEEI